MNDGTKAGARGPVDASPGKLLTVYLTDHYAGSCAGLALASRIARRHADTDMGRDLRWLRDQISQDQRSLLEIMRRFGVQPVKYKNLVAIVGEYFSRLKLNGQFVRSSPLSTAVELLSMQLGVYGKRCGWQDMRELADHVVGFDAGELDTLIVRAGEQISRLEEMRRIATVRSLGGN